MSKKIQQIPKVTDGVSIKNDKGVLKLNKNFVKINDTHVKLGDSITVGNGLSLPISNSDLANSSITVNGSALNLGDSITVASALPKCHLWTASQGSGLKMDGWSKISDPDNLVTISSQTNRTNNKITINNTGLYTIDLNFTISPPNVNGIYDTFVCSAVGSTNTVTSLTYNGIPLNIPGNDFLLSPDTALDTFTRGVKLYIDVTDVTGTKHIGENGNNFSMYFNETGSKYMGHIEITRLGDT